MQHSVSVTGQMDTGVIPYLEMHGQHHAQHSLVSILGLSIECIPSVELLGQRCAIFEH